MQMILDPVDPVKMAMALFQNAPDVPEKIRTTVRAQAAFTILRRKDQVVIDLGKGGHSAWTSKRVLSFVPIPWNCFFGAPLQGAIFFERPFRRFPSVTYGYSREAPPGPWILVIASPDSGHIIPWF